MHAELRDDRYSPEEMLALTALAMDDLHWPNAFASPERLEAQTCMRLFSSGTRIVVSRTVEGVTVEARPGLADRVRRNADRLLGELTAQVDIAKRLYDVPSLDQLYAARSTGDRSAKHRIVLGRNKCVVTFILIAVNLAVFAVFAAGTHSLTEIDARDLYHWGGNSRLSTQSGQWWRLITYMFLHGGLDHLLPNMVCLYLVGRYLEPITGRFCFLVCYLGAGVIAGLTSIWWHAAVSIGASGAIMGLFGTLIVLSFTEAVPDFVRTSLLQGFSIFTFYSLAEGMGAGIDNASHLGGLASGALSGLLLSRFLEMPDRRTLAGLFIILITVSAAAVFLNAHKVERLRLVKGSSEFDSYAEQAFRARRGFNVKTKEEQLRIIREVIVPAWRACQQILEQGETPGESKARTALLKRYVGGRLAEAVLLERSVRGDRSAPDALDSIRLQLNDKIDSLLRPVRAPD